MQAAHSPGSAVLEIDGIRKAFPLKGGNRREVLDGVSGAVLDKELVSIIGPSGCGKTTLLRIIAGLIAPDAGSVKIDGRALTGPSPDAAIVFQDSRLLPWKNVRGNVEFALELKHHRRASKQDKEEAAYYIEAVGLTGSADAYPHQLSGGMQQRAGVARALARSPRVLIMDEPFGALDAQTRLVMQEFLINLRARLGITTLLVTHDIDEAVYMSNRCIVLTRAPARVRSVVDIALPSRDGDVRSTPAFGALRGELWNLLKRDAEEEAGG